MESVTVDQAIEVLNRIHEKDPRVMLTLISARVICNQELADDETVQVKSTSEHYLVGLLGILNGIFGIREDGKGYIVANFEEGRLLSFSRTAGGE